MESKCLETLLVVMLHEHDFIFPTEFLYSYSSLLVTSGKLLKLS